MVPTSEANGARESDSIVRPISTVGGEPVSLHIRGIPNRGLVVSTTNELGLSGAIIIRGKGRIYTVLD